MKVFDAIKRQNNMSSERIDTKNLASYILFALALLFLVLRAPYGWCFNDEPFLVTLAQRLYMGDSLLVDEWNPAQVVGPILLPFYALFNIVSKDNTGILLAFRYCYCVLWLTTCITVFQTVKKQCGSLLVSFCVFFYLIPFAPLDYMTLSYTSLGLMSCLMLCCLLLKSREELKIPFYCYALMVSVPICILVLSTPHMVLAYAVVWIASAIALFFKKNRADTCSYHLKAMMMSGVYLGAAAAFYCYFLIIRRIELSSLLPSVHMILAKPDSVTQSSIINRMINVVKSIFDKSLLYSVCLVVSSLTSIIFQKRMRPLRLGMFILCTVGFLWAQYWFLMDQMRIKFNYQMIDIALLGLAAFTMLDSKPWKLFFSFSCIGIVYTLLRGVGTDTGLASAGMTLTVCGVSSIVYIFQLCHEIREQYKKERRIRTITLILWVCLFVIQFCSEGYVKLFRQYWDRKPITLKETVEVGAAKGLITNRYDKEAYELQYYNLKKLLKNVDTDNPDVGFVSFSSSPIIYLDANLRFGTFSSWTFPYRESLLSALEAYKEINPDCRQTVFFAEEEDDIPKEFNTKEYVRFDEEGSVLLVEKSVLKQ